MANDVTGKSALGGGHSPLGVPGSVFWELRGNLRETCVPFCPCQLSLRTADLGLEPGWKRIHLRANWVPVTLNALTGVLSSSANKGPLAVSRPSQGTETQEQRLPRACSGRERTSPEAGEPGLWERAGSPLAGSPLARWSRPGSASPLLPPALFLSEPDASGNR